MIPYLPQFYKCTTPTHFAGSVSPHKAASFKNEPSCSFLNYEFSNQKLASVLHHRRPWQVQKLTSLSIFEREGLSMKFCFITDCIALTSHGAVVFFLFLIILRDSPRFISSYAASFSCSFLIRFLMLYPINNRPISTLTFSVPRT